MRVKSELPPRERSSLSTFTLHSPTTSGRSLKVRRLPWEQEQAGALPVVPTTFLHTSECTECAACLLSSASLVRPQALVPLFHSQWCL